MSASVSNSAKPDVPTTSVPGLRSRTEALKLAKLPRVESKTERRLRSDSNEGTDATETCATAGSSGSAPEATVPDVAKNTAGQAGSGTRRNEEQSLHDSATSATSAPTHRSPFVVAGLWLFHLRNALYAGTGSATVHMIALVSLSILFPEPPRVQRAIVKVSLQVEVVPENVRPEPPDILTEPKIQVESSVLSVVPVSLETAKGLGSIGSGGGKGGGSDGGTAEAGLQVGPASLASGGTGFGIDKAFGTHMLGEVGEKADNSATFFGLKAEGKTFVFVVDTSGSMRSNDRYLRCRNELWKSISAMKYGQQYFIMFFNHDLYAMPENKLVDARPAQLKRTGEWMLGAVPSGGTVPWPGLERAFRLKPDAIYLLTDGEFDPEVVQRVNRIQPETKKKIPVHTIAFESIRGSELLKVISHVSGGQHMYVP